MTALHSQPYKDAIDRVIRRRLELGWSQEELARRLPRYEKASASDEPPGAPERAGGQLQSYVSKFEQRLRRLDVTEFEHVCHALGLRVADAIEEHKWNGEPPPRVVPLARDPHIEERQLGQRRVKPGRKPRAAPTADKPAPEPEQTRPATTRRGGWPPERPLGGAGHSVEASDQERQRAAESPERAPRPQAKRDAAPKSRRRKPGE